MTGGFAGLGVDNGVAGGVLGIGVVPAALRTVAITLRVAGPK